MRIHIILMTLGQNHHYGLKDGGMGGIWSKENALHFCARTCV